MVRLGRLVEEGEGRTSFLKKRSKKLFANWDRDLGYARAWDGAYALTANLMRSAIRVAPSFVRMRLEVLATVL